MPVETVCSEAMPLAYRFGRRASSLHPRPCLFHDQAAPGIYLELDVHGEGRISSPPVHTLEVVLDDLHREGQPPELSFGQDPLDIACRG